VREAVAPIPQNGCYGYLIWVNASKPCVGPRVVDRPVSDDRDFPTLPADMYQFAGLFGQLVTVFPGEGLVVTRFGQDTGSIAGGAPWEEEFYRQVLGSITDQAIEMPKPKPDVGEVSREDVDRGFLDAIQHSEQYGGGELPPPLPPAGPARARATLIELRARRPGPQGTVKVRLHCPRAWPSGLRPRCTGKARLTGASAHGYRIRAGKTKQVRFTSGPASCAVSTAIAGSTSRSRPATATGPPARSRSAPSPCAGADRRRPAYLATRISFLLMNSSMP
jgi:hypothetical protein